MNLLLINYEYPPLGGGAANATRQLALAFQRLGHTATVVTAAFPSLPSREWDAGVTVRRLPCRRKRTDRSNPLEMLSFLRAGRRAVPAIAREIGCEAAVVFFTLPCGPIGLDLNRELGIPYIVSLRGGDVPGLVPELRLWHRLLTPFRRRILRHATAIIANDAALAALSRSADPFPVEVVPNGVDSEFYQPPAHPADTTPFRWLFAGRIHAQKNLAYLLTEYARLPPDQRGELHLVGDGPERPALEAHAATLGISRELQWHGWMEKNRLREIYRHANAFLNPSHYEGMPNTVLEAMACGLPAILSDIPAHVRLSDGGRAALLAECAIPGRLAAAMGELLSDTTRRGALGEAARAQVVARYTWTRAAESYLAHFDNSLKSPGPNHA